MLGLLLGGLLAASTGTAGTQAPAGTQASFGTQASPGTAASIGPSAPAVLHEPSAAPASGAALPPAVLAVLPALAEAERQLQDATLDLEAARREAEPAQREADEARDVGGWWGGWLLRRRLAGLKVKLDAVEAARRSQAAARQSEFTLLTGLEEELRSTLEKALGSTATPGAGTLALWWEQKQAWTRRVEALEAAEQSAAATPTAGEPGGRSLLVEARLEQLERDARLLDALRARGVLDRDSRAAQARDLELVRRWWRALDRASRVTKN